MKLMPWIVILIFTCISHAEIFAPIALYSNKDGKECFLSSSEQKILFDVIKSARRIEDAPSGKLLPIKFVFHYWVYDRPNKALKKQTIPFASSIEPILLVIDHSHLEEITDLVKGLEQRVK